MAINSDFSELFAAFNAAEVRYLVVGAYAVIHYTEPRYTTDLDVWVAGTPENAPRVLASLAQFGAPIDGLTVADLQNPEVIYQIGIEPNRIDILVQIAGVDFETAYARATTTEYGVPIRLLSFDDLILSKRAAGREQDLLDVKRLLQSRSGGQ